MLHVNISLLSKKEESENKFYLEKVQILSEKLGPFNYNKIIINRWEWTKISGSRPQTKIVANSILMKLALISFLKFIYLFTSKVLQKTIWQFNWRYKKITQNQLIGREDVKKIWRGFSIYNVENICGHSHIHVLLTK